LLFRKRTKNLNNKNFFYFTIVYTRKASVFKKMSTPTPTPMPIPVPDFGYPDHQRLEHRDIRESISREAYHTRDDVGDLSCKVGEGLLATTANVKDQIAEDYCKLQGSIHRTGEYVGDKVEWSKDKVVDKVDSSKTEVKDTQDRYYIAGQSAAEVRAKALLDAIQRNSDAAAAAVAATQATVERTGAVTRDETILSREKLQEELSAYNTSNLSAHQNTILELTKDVADIKYETVKGFGQASLEHCRDTGVLSKQMSEGFSSTQLEAAKNFAAIQLEAKQNKFELSQQLAECCCEMKEKLIETASATQQLIQANETSRLRDSLASANNENLFLRFAQGSSTVGGGSSSRC
jgi:hypothetical protein